MTAGRIVPIVLATGTLLMGRGCHTMRSRSFARAVVAVIIGSTGVACAMPDQSSSNVIATSGVPSVSAAPTPQAAALGATIEVTTQAGTKAAYTISNFRPATPVNAYFPVKGTLYSVDITIQGEAATVPVNPTYFSASTKDATHVDVLFGAVDNQLAVSELPPGQHVSGQVAFDVPTGMTIAQILLSGPLSSEQAVWSVTSSPPAEQSP
jgi:hypothetical protein